MQLLQNVAQDNLFCKLSFQTQNVMNHNCHHYHCTIWTIEENHTFHTWIKGKVLPTSFIAIRNPVSKNAKCLSWLSAITLGKGVHLISKTVTVIESGLRVEQHIILTNPELKTRDVGANSSLSQYIAHSFLTEVIIDYFGFCL